jgi:hypothetical protein
LPFSSDFYDFSNFQLGYFSSTESSSLEVSLSSLAFPPVIPCLNHPASSASQSGLHFCLFLMFFGTLMMPVSGGGVGGLTLAFALSKSPDIRVDVYEAASKFTEIGAGIGLWWRTRQVLKSLGLEEDVVRLLSFRPGQERGELGEDMQPLKGTLKFLAVPSIQYRKADQSEGHAMGPIYSRGLTFFFPHFACCTPHRHLLYVQVD